MIVARRTFLSAGAAALAGTWLLRPASAAEAPGFVFKAIRGGAGYFTGRGGTIGWLANPDAMVVIDSQFPEQATVCLEGLATRSERALDALINTHHHGDHTAGNGVFAEATQRIIAHARVPELQRAAAEERGTLDDQVYASETYEDEMRLDLGGEIVTLRHFGPAHTGGDSIVHFENANVVHMGDLVFNRWHPFIDVGAGATLLGWAGVLERVLERYPKDAVYIFGHGDGKFGVTGGFEEIALQRDYLLAVHERAEAMQRTGQDPSALPQDAVLEGFPDHVAVGANLSLPANLAAAMEIIERDG